MLLLLREMQSVPGSVRRAELAQVFARFGARVTVVEAAGRLLPAEEPEDAAWAAPAVAVAATSLARGKMTDPPRPALARPAAALQAVLTVRALRAAAAPADPAARSPHPVQPTAARRAARLPADEAVSSLTNPKDTGEVHASREWAESRASAQAPRR